jgi:hypothetical protein
MIELNEKLGIQRSQEVKEKVCQERKSQSAIAEKIFKSGVMV